MQNPLLLALCACALLVSAPTVTLAAPLAQKTIVSPLLSAKSVQYSVTVAETDLKSNGMPRTVTLMQRVSIQQPGQYAIKGTLRAPGHRLDRVVYVCDGKTRTRYNTHSDLYQQAAARPRENRLAFVAAIPPVTPVPAVLNGRTCLLFTQTLSDCKGARSTTHLWLDAATHLPVRQDNITLRGDKPRITYQADYTDWKLNAPLPASLFVFVPPPGVTLEGRTEEPSRMAP